MLDGKSDPRKRKKSENSSERTRPSSTKKSVRSFLNVNPETQFEIVRGLASPVRVRILRLLRRRGPLNVNQISEALGMPQSTIATNIQILEESELIDTEIENSLVLDHSRIQGVHRITDSLLGREVVVERSGARPRATRLDLGDHSRADLE